MKSSNAALQGLTVSAGRMVPRFFSERPSSAVVLPSGADAVSVTATANDPGAAITINGVPVQSGQASPALPLEFGLNFLRVEVTAEDGETRLEHMLKVTRAHPTPNWVKVLDEGPWARRDSAGELVFQDHMWLFGGYIPEVIGDVWRSKDGVSWEQMGDIPDDSGINIPVNFVYDGKMWIVSNGGKFYASEDGRAWTLVSDSLPWGGRYGPGGAVFQGKMWVLGGAGQGKFYNDIWSSTDGAHWTLEVEHAPWSRRQLFGNVVVHDGKLWIIGGGITNYQPFKAYNDVWCSEDGRQWTRVTEDAPWPVRIWSCCAVYRGRIWLLGGFRAQPTWNNFNDLWYTTDGARWEQLSTEEIWEPRHELSAYLHDDRLWVVGGNMWPLMHDAWQLHIPGLAFVSQPVLEEFVTAEYTYRAKADFNASALPICYRLIAAPLWLAIDEDTGLLRGVPPATGVFQVEIEAYDAAGESARQAYTLHVIGV